MKHKIGILGGTFDPIHWGHLLIAQDALEQVGLSCVKFIPAAMAPHKKRTPFAPADDRLRMIELAIGKNRQFEVDDIEIRQGGKSYSVDTISRLRQLNPDVAFYFIIGSDSYQDLHRWRDVHRLAKLCKFVALARPGVPMKNPRLESLLKKGLQIHFVEGHACDISSSEIRRRIAQGRPIHYFLPDAVRQYIERHRLYR